MSKTLPPAGFNWVMPYICVNDVERALAFYEKAFGFETKQKSPGEDGSTWHAEVNYRGQTLMFGKQGAWGGTTKTPKLSGVESPINMYLYCQSVDELCEQAKKAGGEVTQEPQDTFWGDRMCSIKDLDGISWAFATPLA